MSTNCRRTDPIVESSHRLRIQLFDANWVPAGYQLDAGWVPAECRLGADWVPAGCRLGADWVPAGCRLGTGWCWLVPLLTRMKAHKHKH